MVRCDVSALTRLQNLLKAGVFEHGKTVGLLSFAVART